jgi:hypothetical protein
MPDLQRIERELHDLLSRPYYSSLFYHRNQFSNQKAETPTSLAANTVEWMGENTPFTGQVTVEELTGKRLEMYRMYDGVSRNTALTLGRSWVERSVVETIWSATARWAGNDREGMFMDMMRSANFIHPQWNLMKSVACMQVDLGKLVVVRGRGTWEAMRPKPGRVLFPVINSPEDVMALHGSMPIQGTFQCIVPLYSDMWVRQVPRAKSTWPLLT